MKRDHDLDGMWICEAPEEPIGNRRWSYQCGLCMLKLAAAFANGDMDDVEETHRSEILESLKNSS